ncbi:hypothetical protein [Streptomyces sp. VNUA24]|uniref:hypothetical protein n=1 Tax=Streptomyces sp. VNUA24 TaxID=3031131 RepID=UPI0023B87146|nr:hypothetical protein [Streptomyces sp. VNUA24]WEH16907.1 hypothetical protein PYR72_25650 [Streptomyces sp. VNUA24]
MIVTGAPTTHAAAARRPRASGTPVTGGTIADGPTTPGAGLLPPYAEGIPIAAGGSGDGGVVGAPGAAGVRAPGTCGACP